MGEMVLIVDEIVQGYTKEFHTVEELKKAVMELCDEDVEEIKITRTINARSDLRFLKQQNAPALQAHQPGQKEPQDYPQQFLPLREVFETKDVKSGIYCTDSRKDNT